MRLDGAIDDFRTQPRANGSACKRLGWFMGAWLFDYRPLEGDHLAPLLQAISVAISVACIAHYLSSRPWCGKRAKAFALGMLFFVGFAGAVGLFREQGAGTIVSTAMPVLLVIAGLVLAYDAFSTSPSIEEARKVTLALAVLSLLIKPVLHYYTADDVTLEDVRFQIVSGSMVLVLAHCVVSFFTSPRPRDLLLLSLVVVLIATSVTRGFVIVGVGAVLFNLGLSWSSVNTGRLIRAVFALGASLLILSVAAADSVELILDRWEDRLTPSDDIDFDVTTASRLAEAAYQAETITSSWDRAVFGNGLAAPAFGSGEYADMFYSLFPDQDRFSVGFGHNSVLSLLFVGGWFVGSGMILLALYWGWLAATFTRRWLRSASTRAESYIGCWGATAVFGSLVLSFTGGIFTQRSESLHLGVGLGMLTWALDAVTRSGRVRTIGDMR